MTIGNRPIVIDGDKTRLAMSAATFCLCAVMLFGGGWRASTLLRLVNDMHDDIESLKPDHARIEALERHVNAMDTGSQWKAKPQMSTWVGMFGNRNPALSVPSVDDILAITGGRDDANHRSEVLRDMVSFDPPKGGE